MKLPNYEQVLVAEEKIGETVAIVAVSADQIRLVGRKEIANARVIEPT